jgi:magnesium-protoporphyrin O-methyltransferase
MTFCPHCEGADAIFDQKTAEGDLRDYQKGGAGGTTKRLLDAIKAAGVSGLSLLDIGGGVGVIQHELAAAGVERVTDVDASRAYLRMAREEAERRGYAENAEYVHGDFVALAPQIAEADIVTMDRVICCYPHVEALVESAASKARRYFGVVYPRDLWWTKLGMPVMNFFLRLQGSTFRGFIHPSATVERITASHGFRKVAQHDGWMWQVSVFAK